MTLIAVTIGVVRARYVRHGVGEHHEGTTGSAALFALAFFVLGGAAGAFLASS